MRTSVGVVCPEDEVVDALVPEVQLQALQVLRVPLRAEVRLGDAPQARVRAIDWRILLPHRTLPCLAGGSLVVTGLFPLHFAVYICPNNLHFRGN